jgi:zinc protease
MSKARYIVVLFWMFSITALAGNLPVHEFELENGLKVLVIEDHRAPIVVSQVWYKVGSSYEHDGISGVSHVLEHMMFKGTEKYPPGEFSRIIAENGGRENAFTGRDYTAYFQTLEKSRLPVALELEADRMRNLLLPEQEFLKEVQVVMEERRLRTDDNPQALTREQFNATAFINSPYRIPVIGWMDDLENLEVADLLAWYKRWYAPNNATLVVAGDVEPANVYALAKRFFGPLQPSVIEPTKPRREIKQQGVRRITVRAPAEVPYLILGYKVPVLLTATETWELYALEMLAGVLDGGASSRLARDLVRGDQIAVAAGAGYNLYDRQDSLLLLSGTPAPSHTIDELEHALRGQLRVLREELVDEQELQRVRAQVVASHVYGQDSQFYQAMQVGTLETIGLDWRVRDEYLEKIKAVTAEQVRSVAQKYLLDNRLTIAVLDPLPMDSKERRLPASQGASHGH